jgi:hypothetical protein
MRKNLLLKKVHERFFSSLGTYPNSSYLFFWLVFLALLGGGIVAYFLIIYPLFVVFLLGGIVFILLFYLPSPVLCVGILFLLVTEGVFRKWLFPSLHEWIYFWKDGVALGLIFRFLSSLAKGEVKVPLPFLSFLFLLLSFFWLFLQFFNPRQVGIGVYLFGLRNYLLPVLLFLSFSGFGEKVFSTRFILWLLFSLFPLGVLGIIQSFLPETHVLNQYLGWYSGKPATFGSPGTPVRVTSVFSYISGYSAYLFYLSVLAIYFFNIASSRRRDDKTFLSQEGFSPEKLSNLERNLWNFFLHPFGFSFLFGWILFQVFLTGSRGPLFWIGTSLVSFLILYKKQHKNRFSFMLTFLIVFLSLSSLFFLTFYSHHRFFSEDIPGRIKNILTRPLELFHKGGLFGYGPGSTHQGREVLLRKLKEHGELPPPVEEEQSRILLEIGFAGWTLWYGFFLTLAFWLFTSIKKAPEQNRFGVFLLLVLTLYSMVTGIVTQNTNGYLWGIIGGYLFSTLFPVREKS